MLVGRILGWLLLFVALAILGFDAVRWLQSGEVQAMALGELWYQLSPETLNTAQAGIQRGVHPLLWDPFITSLLLAPASLIAAPPGVLLLVLCRKRQRRRRLGLR
jgi:ABC-type Fe3+ transport system permease subunit